MTYAFTDGYDPGQLAALDQMAAELRQRIEACIMTVAAAKVMHERGDDDGCKQIVNMVTATLLNTPPEEVRAMFSMTVELVANSIIDNMDEVELNALVKGAALGMEDWGLTDDS